MTTEPDYDLLHWVDQLRRTRHLYLLQKFEADAAHPDPWTKITDYEQPSLLQLLRDAQVGGTGSHASAGNGAERIPFNESAIDLLQRLTSQIAGEYLEIRPDTAAQALVLLEPEQVLIDWYRSLVDDISRGVLPEDAEENAKRRARGWCRSVEAFFDPPSIREYVVACPECGERYAYDPANGNRISAMVVLYQPENADRDVKILRAECRFCLQVWEGEDGVRFLMRRLAEADMADRVVVEEEAS